MLDRYNLNQLSTHMYNYTIQSSSQLTGSSKEQVIGNLSRLRFQHKGRVYYVHPNGFAEKLYVDRVSHVGEVNICRATRGDGGSQWPFESKTELVLLLIISVLKN